MLFLNSGISISHKFKNNLIDYQNINVDEIISNIKKIMIDIYDDNIYYKSDLDNYSYVMYNNKNYQKCVINNNVECCIFLQKPKFFLFSFKTLIKDNDLVLLDKIMDISDVCFCE